MERDKERERQDRREREREKRPPRTESEERRRRERRKEREERYKREGRDPKSGARSRPQRNLDLIDKLDVTGIYGEGRKSTENIRTFEVETNGIVQYSTMTARSMHATHTGTRKKTVEHPCKHSQKAQPTWRSEEQAH